MISKSFLLIASLLISVVSRAQVFSHPELYPFLDKKFQGIYSKVLHYALKSPELVFRNDSFSSRYNSDALYSRLNLAFTDSVSANELEARLISGKLICGIKTSFKISSDFSNSERREKIAGFALLFRPDIGGVKLPYTSVCWIRLEETKRILTSDELKLLIIMSNCTHGTFKLSSGSFQVGNPHIESDLFNDISDNSLGSHSFSIDSNYLRLCASVVNDRVQEYFEQKFRGQQNKKQTDFYSDAALNDRYTPEKLREALLFPSILVDWEGDEPSEEIIYEGPYIFPYKHWSKSAKSFGLIYKYDANFQALEERKLFLSLKQMEKDLPEWLFFIIKCYENA